MKPFLLLFAMLFCSFSLFAQKIKKAYEPVKDTVLIVYNGTDSSEMKVDVSPGIVGGGNIVVKIFNKNLRYPQDAIDNDKQGTILIGFVVDVDSTASGFWVKKGADPALDKEALRVVQLLPNKWTPAMINGNPVKVSYGGNVVFKLEGD